MKIETPFFLPRPVRNERGEGWGEGLFNSPILALPKNQFFSLAPTGGRGELYTDIFPSLVQGRDEIMIFSGLKKSIRLGLLVCSSLLFLAGRPSESAEIKSWSLASPDGQYTIAVFLNDGGDLSYEVLSNGKTVIQKSPLGLRCNGQDFEHALAFGHAGSIEKRRETYELFAGAQPRVDHIVNGRVLEFRNPNNVPLAIELAASNEGVAFRYRFSQSSTNIRIVESELTGFTLSLNARGWLQPYHAAGRYTPAYEDFYFPVSPGDPPPDSRAKAVGWAFPALFYVPDASAWVLLTESGTDESYCACHLNPDCSGGVYRIAFPLADETTQGYTNKFGPEPRYTTPWTMPWRVMVLGKSAGDIATETLVTDLAQPSLIADTSWIHPGRASWAWWSYPDEPATAKRFNEFTDFAAKMGWEYTLFDAGWRRPD